MQLVHIAVVADSKHVVDKTAVSNIDYRKWFLYQCTQIIVCNDYMKTLSSR